MITINEGCGVRSELRDSCGRVLDYLRVSITDRCNLRCIYCMPPEGVEWKPHDNILTFEQILRIVKIFSGLGVRKIRITGGEPLLRRGASSFFKELKLIPGIEKTALTTNGLLLGTYLDKAGEDSLPDSINISLDALDNENCKFITRSVNAKPSAILALIDRLLEKLITVKINCVPMRSVNENEILSIAALAKDKNIIVRFIELMPFGIPSGDADSCLQFVPGDEAAQMIEKAFGVLVPFNGIFASEEVRSKGPAVYYSLSDFKGKIGFINAVTHGFCGTCNRLRLTSEGFLKLCLSSTIGLDLKELIKTGADDIEISDAIAEAVLKKPRFHTLSKIYGEQKQHQEGMSKIGG